MSLSPKMRAVLFAGAITITCIVTLAITFVPFSPCKAGTKQLESQHDYDDDGPGMVEIPHTLSSSSPTGIAEGASRGLSQAFADIPQLSKSIVARSGHENKNTSHSNIFTPEKHDEMMQLSLVSRCKRLVDLSSPGHDGQLLNVEMTTNEKEACSKLQNMESAQAETRPINKKSEADPLTPKPMTEKRTDSSANSSTSVDCDLNKSMLNPLAEEFFPGRRPLNPEAPTFEPS